MNRLWCLVVLSIATCAWAGEPSRTVTQSVYLSYIKAPAIRAARSTWCAAIRNKSIPVDRSTEDSTERSEEAGMELLTQQLDCRDMDAFYAELSYAASQHVLGEGAWQSCLQFAPVHQLKSGLDLAIYMQCLHAIQGAKVCQAARMDTNPYSLTGTEAACAQLIRTRDWSQWGLSVGDAKERTVSLFFDPQAPAGALPPGGQRIVGLPAQITLAGRLRIGFDFNCCQFGQGFMMPFSYLHLLHTVTVCDDQIGTVSVQDIELDQDVAPSLVNKPVNVSCNLDSGITGHYALSVYCNGTQIQP